MRYTIRLLTLGTLAFFIAALWVADQGERAVATTPAQRYPGLEAFFILWALLALTLLLFLLLSAFGIALALKQRDQLWGIAIALIVMDIGALYLGSFLPPGILLPVVRRVLLSSAFQALPLTFLPALLGSVVVAFLQKRARKPPSFKRGMNGPSPCRF
jgi:hypothetical protein